MADFVLQFLSDEQKKEIKLMAKNRFGTSFSNFSVMHISQKAEKFFSDPDSPLEKEMRKIQDFLEKFQDYYKENKTFLSVPDDMIAYANILSHKFQMHRDNIYKMMEYLVRNSFIKPAKEIKPEVKNGPKTEVKKKICYEEAVKAGSVVVHSRFGLGRVYEINNDYVKVSFGAENIQFEFPQAFEDEYLILSDES